MINTTLCHIEKDGKYLMLHRVKKKNDLNQDKWVGIGGKFEKGETPFQCALREIEEETGIIPLNLRYRGIVEFISDKYETENMHLFTADGFEGEIKKECAEGELVWIKKEQINNLKIWEGDKIFFDLLEREEEFFYLTLKYKGDKLIEHKINIKSN
jgi:8-oxo-dGTP diphosphatase